MGGIPGTSPQSCSSVPSPQLSTPSHWRPIHRQTRSFLQRNGRSGGHWNFTVRGGGHTAAQLGRAGPPGVKPTPKPPPLPWTVLGGRAQHLIPNLSWGGSCRDQARGCPEMWVHARPHACLHVYNYLHAHVCVCTCMCVCTHVHKYKCTCMCGRERAHVHGHVFCVHACMASDSFLPSSRHGGGRLGAGGTPSPGSMGRGYGGAQGEGTHDTPQGSRPSCPRSRPRHRTSRPGACTACCCTGTRPGGRCALQV